MDIEIHKNWRSTERTATPAAPAPQNVVIGQMNAAHVRVDPSMAGSSLRLAAVSGILLVIASGAAFYFGVDFLRASLTSSTINVTLTSDGVFDPDTINVVPGDTIVIENQHDNPQLIAPDDGSEHPPFSPIIVAAGSSATQPINGNVVAGTTDYIVRTLPDAHLTITVDTANATATGTGSDTVSDSSDASSASTDTLATQESSSATPMIPDISEFLKQAAPTNAVSSTASIPTTPVPQIPQQAVFQPPVQMPPQNFALPPDAQAINTLPPMQGADKIALNPYTVGNTKARPLPQATDKLHGGAPLKHPPVEPSTGTATWVIAILALISIVPLARKTSV